jgi:hypothetical protein
VWGDGFLVLRLDDSADATHDQPGLFIKNKDVLMIIFFHKYSNFFNADLLFFLGAIFYLYRHFLSWV